MIVSRLGAKPLVIQLPIGVESSYVGLVDLIEMKEVVWKDEALGAGVHAAKFPPNCRRKRRVSSQAGRGGRRNGRLGDGSLSRRQGAGRATLKKCIRKGTISGAFVPVLCGAAFKNKGVQPMLDAVIDFLPAPTDVAAVMVRSVGSDVEETRQCSDDEPFAGLAFKIMTDPFVGSLTFVRIYSGVFLAGTRS